MELTEELQDIIARRLMQLHDDKHRQMKKNTKAGATSHEDQPLTAATAKGEALTTENEFVKAEKNLISLGFFSPSSKSIKKGEPKIIRFTRNIEGQKVEAKVTIAPVVLYGLPSTADQDKYMAFLKIVEAVRNTQGKVENPICFTTYELLKIQGKDTTAGKSYKEVIEWLKVMKTTSIISEGAVYFAGKRKWATDAFSVFERIIAVGQELSDNTIADKNYVWLSEWQLENINNNHLLPIDYDTYKQLKNNISKTLIPFLQVWLYASREQGVFEKKYDEICDVLGIKKYNYLSKVREKLSPSLNELVGHGYLAAWNIERTADGKGYKLIFRHGEKFYQDQAKRLTRGKTPKNAPIKQPKQPEATKPQLREKDAAMPPNFASSGNPGVCPPPKKTETALDLLTDEGREVVKRLHVDYQISLEKASELAKFHLPEAQKQLEAFPFRNINPSNKAGFLIDAIEKQYSVPEEYHHHLSELAFQEQRAKKQSKIDACDLCNSSGWRNIKSERDRMFGVMRECSHDPDIESYYEEHLLEIPPDYKLPTNDQTSS